jgi:hypothetical protein
MIMYQGCSCNIGRAADRQTWPILTDRQKDRERADGGLGKTSPKQKPEKLLKFCPDNFQGIDWLYRKQQ